MIQEKAFRAVSGWPVPVVLLIGFGLSLWGMMDGIRGDRTAQFVTGLVALMLDVFLMLGLFVVNPNEGKVLQLFGKYVGSR